jgi:hypothetical protein
LTFAATVGLGAVPVLAADADAPVYKAPANSIPIGSWAFNPALVLGATYDDNVYRSATKKVGLWGFRVKPSLTAAYEDGIHRTNVYATFDGRFYADDSRANTYDAKAGFTHLWEIQRDLIFRASGDYTRIGDVFNNGTVPPPGIGVTDNHLNAFGGAASLEKKFDSRFFIVGGGRVNYTAFDNKSQQSRDGVIFGPNGRFGYWATPQMYTFVDVSYDWRRYDSAQFNSDGYRVTAGLGSDVVQGLYRGEVFAGYQAQKYAASSLGWVGTPAYGARGYYYPTRYWTIRGTIDRTIGVSSVVPVIGSPVGTSMLTTQIVLESSWALWRQLTVTGRGGYYWATYVNAIRRDEAWQAGATLNYVFWSNLALWFDYQYTRLSSNVTLTRYDRNQFTVGASYKY